MARTVGISIRQDDVRDIQTLRTQQLHVRREIGAPHRADGDAEHVERNVQRLGERRDEKPLGIALDEDHASREENLATADIDVALEVRLIAARSAAPSLWTPQSSRPRRRHAGAGRRSESG